MQSSQSSRTSLDAGRACRGRRDLRSRQGVFVIADEVHCDLALPPHSFTPFATVAVGASWAALHGPLKTFGLAGVCDTLAVMPDGPTASLFAKRSSQLHLTRNNVFGLAAFEVGYRTGGPWLDGLLDLVATNRDILNDRLPAPLRVSDMEGTYLAWIDLWQLDLEVPGLASWLAHSARLR